MTNTQVFHVPGVDSTKVDQIIRDYQENGGNALTILQAVQEMFGYLPFEVVEFLSEKIGIPLGKMYGIATFYAQFKFHQPGKNIITICDGTACHVKGSIQLGEFITKELGIKNHETTPDNLFSLEKVACFGCCALAPVVFINKDVYGNMTPAKLRKILNKYRESGAQ
jgi:NADH-quinone oxidoreductase subunit E